MKLQSLADGAQYALTGYGPGYLEVNRVRHATGLLVLEHSGRMRLFECSGAALMRAYLDRALARLAPGSESGAPTGSP